MKIILMYVYLLCLLKNILFNFYMVDNVRKNFCRVKFNMSQSHFIFYFYDCKRYFYLNFKWCIISQEYSVKLNKVKCNMFQSHFFLGHLFFTFMTVKEIFI